MKIFMVFVVLFALAIPVQAEELELRTRTKFEGQLGGCQLNKPFEPNVDVVVLPQKVDFIKDVASYDFSHLSEEIISEWLSENNVYVYWIPEKHMAGGHVIVSGIGYDLELKRYEKPIDKAANLICGYYSDVKLMLFFTSKVIMSDSISKDKCRYEAYIEHMKKHNEKDNEVFQKYIQTLKEGEIFDIIAYGEGDEYVGNTEWVVRGLQQKQASDITKAFGAFVQSIANEAQTESNLLDTGDEDLRLKEELRACRGS